MAYDSAQIENDKLVLVPIHFWIFLKNLLETLLRVSYSIPIQGSIEQVGDSMPRNGFNGDHGTWIWADSPIFDQSNLHGLI